MSNCLSKFIRLRSASLCFFLCDNENDNEIFFFCLHGKILPPLRHILLRFRSFRREKKPQDIDFYTYPRAPGMYVWVRVDVRFSRVYMCTRLCVYAESGGVSCVIYSSVVVRCEKDNESFRLPFSNRLDFTIKRKENFYMAQAPRDPSTCTRPF